MASEIAGPEMAAPEPERTAELLEDFEYFDEDQDGLMQFAEFESFMDGNGADMTLEQCRIGFAEIDTDRDGAIEFEEFLEWWLSE
jgi:Ca2+-binding EF-hand superfamily protein